MSARGSADPRGISLGATAAGSSGVDLTAEFVRIAEMLTQLTGLVGRVDYRQGSALDLPFEDMSFDVVWSQNVAMNIADRDRLYGEMRRVLKPGGKLASAGGRRRTGRSAALPGAVGADARHQLSLFAAGDPREARNGRVPRSSSGRIRPRRHWPRRWRGVQRQRPPPVLGTHLIVGADWRAMFRNSARNLDERRTELFNAVLEPRRLTPIPAALHRGGRQCPPAPASPADNAASPAGRGPGRCAAGSGRGRAAHRRPPASRRCGKPQ